MPTQARSTGDSLENARPTDPENRPWILDFRINGELVFNVDSEGMAMVTASSAINAFVLEVLQYAHMVIYGVITPSAKSSLTKELSLSKADRVRLLKQALNIGCLDQPSEPASQP